MLVLGPCLFSCCKYLLNPIYSIPFDFPWTEQALEWLMMPSAGTLHIFLYNHVQNPIIIIAYLICLLQIEFISVGHLIPFNAAGSEYPRCSEYPSQVAFSCMSASPQ